MFWDDDLAAAGMAAPTGPLAWWWRMSGPPVPGLSAGFDKRERFARGRMVSSALVFYFVLELLLLPIAVHLPLVLASEVVVFAGNSAAVWLNRSSRVEAAGTLLVACADAALIIGMQGAPGHLLDVFILPGLDLFVVSTMIAAVALPPRWVFPVAFVNISLVVAQLLFQPRTPALQQLMASQWYLVFSRPICLQFIVASIAYMWVRGTFHAARRADLAEEVAALRQREVEHNRELADGVRQLLETHAQVANGDLHARAPIIRGSLLFPLSAGLNNLISRLAAAENRERLAEAQAQQLCRVLSVRRNDERIDWPSPCGTFMDAVTAALRNSYASAQLSGRAEAAPEGSASSASRSLGWLAPLGDFSADAAPKTGDVSSPGERSPRDGYMPARTN